ncbi:MAG: glycoside hydrolase family 9 protein [Calditrichaceae bacterium]|nr:glycoside hydrolase family 9 protein [Calditrichaceae bacterium]MBN2707844.1 glycoside hydrolase family 9 protein [Calditrichaceae bacterium]RQV94910.1 MAG: glycoside hydrolase [Calditrichota bacterium]
MKYLPSCAKKVDKYLFYILIFIIFFVQTKLFAQSNLEINDLDYFEMPGLNVTVFSDFYPEGHQHGVTIIQHGERVASNGDLRLEISPGQWSSVPKKGKRSVDKRNKTIMQHLWYPDSSRDRKGFNPIKYPDLHFRYDVSVTALEKSKFKIIVNLDNPLPAEWIGRVGFNLELFPGMFFGKAFLMDDQSGIFPIQPDGPVRNYYDDYLAEPLASGTKLVLAPEKDDQRIMIESENGLELWDGRANHNNGWFIVRSVVPANKSKAAIEWIITPDVIEDWQYTPVIHLSQLGYHPDQKKTAIIEQDKTDIEISDFILYKLSDAGKEEVLRGKPVINGPFLRYKYLTFEFSAIKEAGMYLAEYRSTVFGPFKIGKDVYDRHAWQPVMDYFLPVQMCHMRVNEKYRVWHGLCHMDDALMAPVDTNHFDGYMQGNSTFTDYKPLQPVPGLNAGGWHDAGDYDLRVESQIGTIWTLSLIIEEFGLDYDATLIDQKNHLVEIHVPDGKSDLIQQIEHGLASVLGGYRSLGRLYRGIICSDLRQYVLLGDGSVMTDNLVYDDSLEISEIKNGRSGKPDDRWVFTEENPDRSLNAAAGLAAASRVLKASNPELSDECLTAALSLYALYENKTNRAAFKIIALAELFQTTNDKKLMQELVGMKEEIRKNIAWTGAAIGRIIHLIEDKSFKKDISEAVSDYQKELNNMVLSAPFGVPYRPSIWGAGWNIQSFGVAQYFFHKGWPEFSSPDLFVNALNFVLGAHPGQNGASFVSGVGAESVLTAYGVNRADWSFIPGGVVSGTAIIQPDLPELKEWPYLWQQTEYVLGGGATNYMFLVLAVDALYD